MRKKQVSSLPVVLAALAVGATSFLLDSVTRQWIDASQTKELRKAMGILSDLGDWPQLMLGALFVFVVALVFRLKEIRRVVLLMILASTFAGMAVNALRLTTGRTRPNNTEAPQGFYGLNHEDRWLISRNKFNSFPSGHVATATGFVVPFVVLFAARGGWLLAFFPLSMAFARMYIGSHHFSDVVVSLLLSSAVAFWVIRSMDTFSLFRRLAGQSSHSKPAPTPVRKEAASDESP